MITHKTIPCEGSNCPPCAILSPSIGMCAMCGAIRMVEDGKMVAHERIDLLRMVEESTGYVAFSPEAAEDYWGDVW